MPLLTVQRTDLMRVVVQVPDRDVPLTTPGKEALIRIDALPGRQLTAKVSHVADREDPQTRLMHVEIDLPNPDGAIRDGMYGEVTIILDRDKDGLSVPSSCIAQGERPEVRLRRQGRQGGAGRRQARSRQWAAGFCSRRGDGQRSGDRPSAGVADQRPGRDRPDEVNLQTSA